MSARRKHLEQPRLGLGWQSVEGDLLVWDVKDFMFIGAYRSTFVFVRPNGQAA